ncbi:MAG: serine hydrolase [Planctomycetes bacterium]|nr:serine hydrolase [Planctomycetota bacterium]
MRDKKLAGAIVMVARRGKVVHFGPYGFMDLAESKPMRRDTIMRFYSMTKAMKVSLQV